MFTGDDEHDDHGDDDDGYDFDDKVTGPGLCVGEVCFGIATQAHLRDETGSKSGHFAGRGNYSIFHSDGGKLNFFFHDFRSAPPWVDLGCAVRCDDAFTGERFPRSPSPLPFCVSQCSFAVSLALDCLSAVAPAAAAAAGCRSLLYCLATFHGLAPTSSAPAKDVSHHPRLLDLTQPKLPCFRCASGLRGRSCSLCGGCRTWKAFEPRSAKSSKDSKNRGELEPVQARGSQQASAFG